MRLHLLTALILGILVCSATTSLAQTPVPQINYKQLREHPLEAHGLKIVIQAFNAGRFSMNLTNTTTSFIAFAPEDMALVDKAGNQLFLNISYLAKTFMPITLSRLRIAPGATLHLDGQLNDREEFPVKVYYFDTLSAIVTAE
jgi:hypothetical protein